MVNFFSAAEKTVYCITVSKGILRTVKKAYKTLVKRACFFACLFCFLICLPPILFVPSHCQSTDTPADGPERREMLEGQQRCGTR